MCGLAIRPCASHIAEVFAAPGIVGQLVFGVYHTRQLWMATAIRQRPPPWVLYLPTVAGSFVSTIVVGRFGHPDWGAPFFGVSALSWLAIESVLPTGRTPPASCRHRYA
jgi:tellurite resistance protein